jgi:hypothetical protein
MCLWFSVCCNGHGGLINLHLFVGLIVAAINRNTKNSKVIIKANNENTKTLVGAGTQNAKVRDLVQIMLLPS